MIKKFSITFLSLFLITVSCTMDKLSSQLIGHYSGTIPCADCPGIIMNLDLKEKAQYASEMIYIDKNTTLNEKGIWKVVNEKDAQGNTRTIIQLAPEKSSATTYLHLRNNTTLQLLDSNKNPVPGSELKKQVY